MLYKQEPLHEVWALQSADNSRLDECACRAVKNIGKPCAGKPHARFDEGGLTKDSMEWLLRHRQTKGAETDRPIPTETGVCLLLYLKKRTDTDNDGILDGVEDANDNGAEDSSESDPTAAPAAIPFSDGFESGSLENYWTTNSTGAGRIQVTTVNGPAAGIYHLTMDTSTNGFYSLNEAVLNLDLSPYAGGSSGSRCNSFIRNLTMKTMLCRPHS